MKKKMLCKKSIAAAVMAAMIAVLGGCAADNAEQATAGTNSAVADTNSAAADTSSAAADTGADESQAAADSASQADDSKADWPEKVTIVQMPNEQNPDAGERNEGFRQAIEAYLGIPVEELEGTEYAVGIEAMKSDKLDVLLVTPMSYYQAKTVAGAEPLVTSGTLGGAEYKTVFVTQSGRDDINSLEDLKDKTFAFVDPASSSGYMYPKAKLLSALGLDTDQLETPGYFFKTVAYSGKHDSSLMGVVNGDYDAAAIALQFIDQMSEAGLINAEDVKIIGETDIIPNPCYVIRGNLPESLKTAIKDFYLQYDDGAYFEALYGDASVRFTEAKDSDYAVVNEMVTLLKIEE